MQSNFDLSDFGCYSHLWMAVLAKAVDDALLTLPDPSRYSYKELHTIKAGATLWIKSKATGPGSMVWICTELGLEPEDIREQYDRRHRAGTRIDDRLGRPRPVASDAVRDSVDTVSRGRPEPAALDLLQGQERAAA